MKKRKLSISIFILLCLFPIVVSQPLKENGHAEGKVLIKEVYPIAHPNLNNEFITLYNPSGKTIDLSGWFITLDPSERPSKGRRIIFPWGTKLQPKEQIIITENVANYLGETGRLPDFTYSSSPFKGVEFVIEQNQFKLSNKGAAIVLKNKGNQTIDELVYGEAPSPNGWKGEPLLLPAKGVIIERKSEIDTNGRDDWKADRRIGQSSFELTKFNFDGNIIVFASPDSSYFILREEIKNASESIFLNLYKFINHGLAWEILNASKRGVKVYLLLESGPVGGMDKEEVALVNLLSKAGCESRFMINSPSELRFCPYPFNHAKYAILDNQSLIIHSANWDLNGIPLNPTFGNRKWGAVIENETIARYFSNLFFTDYNPLLLYSVALNETQFFNQTIELSDILDNINNVSLSGDYDPKFLAKEINGSFSLIPALSPDNSLEVLTQLIGSAEDSILIEQLYFYERLGSERNPLLEELLKTEERGVKIKVLLNFNPDYSRWGMDTNDQNQATVDFLLEHGIEARLLYTNSTSFTNLHNKAIIVDSEKVLLSSINLNANGLLKNREVGVIIQNREVANYFEGIFNYDWEIASGKGGNSLLVKVVAVGIAFLLAGGLIYRNWRKK